MQFCSRRCYSDFRLSNLKRDTYLKSGARHIHRIVAESVLGRPLNGQEIVHHIDLDRRNNRPENLCVFPNQAFHGRCHFGEMRQDELEKFMLLRLATPSPAHHPTDSFGACLGAEDAIKESVMEMLDER